MAETRSGLFTLKEFSYRRNVLKIAPDAFVIINGALTSRVLSPMETNTTQDIDIRGGISSINVSCAVSPPGASRATIEVVAPVYKGMHEDYYITAPNGTRVPFFTPMMEVKIYMKGRFLEKEYGYSPRYYPVFWGMITGIQENYSGGNYTFSITCEDFLVWWKYQKININPSVVDSYFGGPHLTRFPSVFERMSAWEIIYALFTDNFFIQHNPNGSESFYNMVYPKWSKSARLPESLIPIRDSFGPLSSIVIDYWNDRFGFGVRREGTPASIKSDLEKIPLEMFGLKGPVRMDSVRNKLLAYLDTNSSNFGEQADRRAELDLDFGLLARVQPYGQFDLFGGGTESTIHSKLEIATAICEKTFMEFFVDTNGMIVFKPPFYNLDVASGQVKYYKVGPEDIINFNANFDSNSIINYLTVTGPLYQALNSLEAIGFHADFDSMRRYGIRSEQANVPYGMNARQLKLIAVAEMNRRNGQAFTGSVSIPLRPEMRLGYPVYLEHIDTFYYVTGINHNFTFGSASTTDLTLQFRREKLFEDGKTGLVDSELGDVLYACVMRSNEQEIVNILKDSKPDIYRARELIENLTSAQDLLRTGTITDSKYKTSDLDRKINEWKKELLLFENNIFVGSGLMGLWKIDRAQIRYQKVNEIKNADDERAAISNELVMMTDDTVPYTDKAGYRHVGAFPYGANLIITKDGKMLDSTNFIDKMSYSVEIQKNCNGIDDESYISDSSENNQDRIGNLDDSPVESSKNIFDHIKEFNEEVKKVRELREDMSQQQNEQANPDIYNQDKKRYGLAELDKTDFAVNAQLSINIYNTDDCIPESNQQEINRTS